MDVISRIQNLAKDFHSQIVACRRHLHANPELSFKEYNTQAFVWSELDKIGISKKQKIADTGIVALIEGKNPQSKAIALRADMDALPIQETNDVEYKSKNAGVMHACGHDVHTSCLLGAAKILNELKQYLSEVDYPNWQKLYDSKPVTILN